MDVFSLDANHTQTRTFGSRCLPLGLGSSLCMFLETHENTLLGRTSWDFGWDIPEVPEKSEKKQFAFKLCTLNSIVAYGEVAWSFYVRKKIRFGLPEIWSGLFSYGYPTVSIKRRTVSKKTSIVSKEYTSNSRFRKKGSFGKEIFSEQSQFWRDSRDSRECRDFRYSSSEKTTFVPSPPKLLQTNSLERNVLAQFKLIL